MVREVAETLWSARTDDDLLDTVGLVAQLSSVLAAVEAGAVAEVDTRSLATDRLRYGSTGDWLTHTAGLRRGEGRHRVVRAHALTGPLTRTFQALVAGTVSPGQADTIHTALTALPSGGLVRRRGEKVMLTHATRLTGTELARAGRHLVEVVDPDAVDRRLEAALERQERAAHLDRYLAITEDRAGGVWIKGHGTAEDGALLTAALLPLTRPEPARTDTEGRRRTMRSHPRPAGVRRPHLGRPDHPRPTRPGHEPGPRHPRHPTPAPGHPRPPHPHPRPRDGGHHRGGGDHRRRHRPPTRRPPPTGL